jgi:hypothetical protein
MHLWVTLGPRAVTHAERGAHIFLREVVVQAAEVVAQRHDARPADVVDVDIARGQEDLAKDGRLAVRHSLQSCGLTMHSGAGSTCRQERRRL